MRTKQPPWPYLTDDKAILEERRKKMKRKLNPVLLAVALLVAIMTLFATDVAYALAGLTAGNQPTDRAYADSRNNFYLVDTNNPFNYDGRATDWQIWAENANPVQLVIYRKAGAVWSEVGRSELETPSVGSNTFSLSSPISVQAGDYVGIYYPSAGSVSFDKPAAEPWDRGNLTGKVLFTVPGAGSTAFSGSSDRVYSVEVTGDIRVGIDIKPGSYPNSINLGSNGVVPVAILGSADFDASEVDPFSVTLAGAVVRLKGKSGSAGSLEDANGDGFLDLVVQVYTDELALTTGSAEAVLMATLATGGTIFGVDTVNIVPPQ